MDEIKPAFQLKWRDGAYYVSEPNIGNTDCYTREQIDSLRAEEERLVRANISYSQQVLERLRDAAKQVSE